LASAQLNFNVGNAVVHAAAVRGNLVLHEVLVTKESHLVEVTGNAVEHAVSVRGNAVEQSDDVGGNVVLHLVEFQVLFVDNTASFINVEQVVAFT
jgi:hypothetical protein